MVNQIINEVQNDLEGLLDSRELEILAEVLERRLAGRVSMSAEKKDETQDLR